jgi:hypothetical protein
MAGKSFSPQPSDTGAAIPNGMSSPQDETITVTQGGETETVTIGGVGQVGQTVIVTVGGVMQTITVGPGLTSKYSHCYSCLRKELTSELGPGSIPPVPMDTGAAIPGLPGQPRSETITVTREGGVSTVTVHPSKGAQPGETMVVTVGGQKETVTIGAGTPQVTGQPPSGQAPGGDLQPPSGQPPTGAGGDLPTAPIPKLCIIVGQPGADGGPCKPVATMMFAGSEGRPLSGIFIPVDEINNALDRQPNLLLKREAQILQFVGGQPAEASNDPRIATIGGSFRDTLSAPSQQGYGTEPSYGSLYNKADSSHISDTISTESTDQLNTEVESIENASSTTSISPSTDTEYAQIDATKQVSGGPFDSHLKSSVVETVRAKSHGTKQSSSMNILSLVILAIAAVML